MHVAKLLAGTAKTLAAQWFMEYCTRDDNQNLTVKGMDMMELDLDGELGSALKELLTARLADDYSGSIKDQNDAFAQSGKVLGELSDDDAPQGFPMLPDAGEMGILKYLDKHRILTFEEQLHLAADNLQDRGYSKLNQSARKRLSKVWKGCYDGKTRQLETLLTQMLLHPNTRCRLVGSLEEQANWRRDPVVRMLREAHIRLGYEGSIDTVKGFIEDYQSDERYWPLELWETIPVDEFGRPYEHGAKLARAIEGFLLKLVSSALRWESLSNSERSGLLLGAYAASSLMQTRVVLAPLEGIIPNLGDYMVFNRAVALGLGDCLGKPTPLFKLARKMATNFKGHAGISHGELIYLSIQSVTSSVNADLKDLEGLKGSLREYFSGQVSNCLRKIAMNLDTTLDAFKSETNPYKLTLNGVEFINEVQRSVETWFNKLMTVSIIKGYRVSALTADQAANYDYWVSQFMAVLDVNKYQQSFEQFLADKNLDIESIQQRAQKAVLAMDTDVLAEVTQQMAEAKATAEKLLITFYSPLLVSESQRKGEPLSVLEAIDEDGDREKVGDQLLDDMEQTISDLEQQLKAEKKKANDLGKALALSNREVEVLKEVIEDEVGSSCGDYTSLLRNSTPLAVVEAFKLLAGSHVVVLDDALAAVKKSAFKNTTKLMESLTALSEEYYNQIIVEGKPDSVARKTLGMAYRAGESDQTMAIPKLRAQREFKYNGETTVFSQHLTLGTKRGDQATIQVHFKIIDKKLVIARVGTHLDVASS